MTILNHRGFFPAVRAHHAEHAHRWTPGQIVISGQITNRTTLDVAAQLRHAGGGPVVVTIDSSGGDVDAARDIVALLDAVRVEGRRQVRTVIARAESAAGVVAQAGSHRTMRTHGRIGMHLPYRERTDAGATVTATLGAHVAVGRDERAPEAVRVVALKGALSLLACADWIAGAYAARTGRPAEVWRSAMVDEANYGAYAAVLAGLADEVEA